MKFTRENRYSVNRLSYRDCIGLDTPLKVFFATTTSTSHTTSSSSTSSTSTSSTSSSSSTSTTLALQWNNYLFIKTNQGGNTGIISVAEKIR